MEARYFYSDPVAAAWMAKHFEMRFNARHAEEDVLWETYIESYANHIHWSALGWADSDERFYIHPDSLHLLDPIDGDVIFSPCGGGYFKVAYTYLSSLDHIPLHHAKEFVRDPGYEARVILRKRKPFHWPESDAA